MVSLPRGIPARGFVAEAVGSEVERLPPLTASYTYPCEAFQSAGMAGTAGKIPERKGDAANGW